MVAREFQVGIEQIYYLGLLIDLTRPPKKRCLYCHYNLNICWRSMRQMAFQLMPIYLFIEPGYSAEEKLSQFM